MNEEDSLSEEGDESYDLLACSLSLFLLLLLFVLICYIVERGLICHCPLSVHF